MLKSCMRSNGFDIYTTPVYTSAEPDELYRYFDGIFQDKEYSTLLNIARILSDPDTKIWEFKGGTYALCVLLKFEEDLNRSEHDIKEINILIDQIFENYLHHKAYIDQIRNPMYLFYNQDHNEFKNRHLNMMYARNTVRENFTTYIKDTFEHPHQHNGFIHYLEDCMEHEQAIEVMVYFHDILNDPIAYKIEDFYLILRMGYSHLDSREIVIDILERIEEEIPVAIIDNPHLESLLMVARIEYPRTQQDFGGI